MFSGRLVSQSTSTFALYTICLQSPIFEVQPCPREQQMPTSNKTSPSSIVRAAVVQTAPVLFDTSKSLQKLADLAADAARQGAELVVFPEAFVGGYPKGHDFGVSV